MHGQETSILTAVIITCAVVALIMVYFIIIMVKHQRRNRALYKEKLEVEIRTLENERKRIAADLHDELGPLLSSVRLQINCVQANEEEDKKILVKSAVHIDSILHRLREIANDLMPGVLLRKGLVPAVREFVNGLNVTHTALKIEFNATDVEIPDAGRTIHLYRITQEIIHNAIRHSGGSLLKLDYAVKGKNLVINATDNGVGFDAEEVLKKGKGLGMSNMLSRVELLHGYFHAESKANKGATINIEIPIK